MGDNRLNVPQQLWHAVESAGYLLKVDGDKQAQRVACIALNPQTGRRLIAIGPTIGAALISMVNLLQS